VVVSLPESPVTAAFRCIAEQVVSLATGDMRMPESQEEAEATRGELVGDEGED